MTARCHRDRAAGASGTVLVGYDDLPVMRPWRAVLPLAVTEPTRPLLTLHTVQTQAAWTRLLEDGVLRGDRDLAEPDWARAYAWMESQMTARGLPGDGMLWLWARSSRRALRDHARMAPGQVLMTVEVPRERVLVSHFGDWHCVLNDGPLVSTTPGEPFVEFDRRYGAVEAAGPAAVAASWDAVFDRSWWAPGDDLQATIRELRAEDVVRAVRIAATRGMSRRRGERAR